MCSHLAFSPQVSSIAHFNDVSCAAAEGSDCGMSVDDTKFNVTGSGVECGVCNFEGEALDVMPGVLSTVQEATTCDQLKSSIEEGASGTFQILNDITCYETISIVEDQKINLTSGGNATAGAPFSVIAGTPFTGGTSGSSSSDADGGAAGGDSSVFVVEKGGALDVTSVKFDTSGATAATNEDEEGTGTSPTTSATGEGGESAGGVRAIYNAGNVTADRCEFVGAGSEDAQVTKGGAVRSNMMLVGRALLYRMARQEKGYC